MNLINMNDQERYERQKKMYIEFKNILGKLSKQDKLGKALASALPIEWINLMESYVLECEDMGFKFVIKENIVN